MAGGPTGPSSASSASSTDERYAMRASPCPALTCSYASAT
ncbi:Uncharacterised protein [Mycobacteroides abscessus]|nr:Uncharacterised protein [Mycobacteroides abscessus]